MPWRAFARPGAPTVGAFFPKLPAPVLQDLVVPQQAVRRAELFFFRNSKRFQKRTLYFLTQEAPDGLDTLDWIGKQDWFKNSNKNVGTFGTSYQAWTQSAAATQNPKNLNGMIVNMGGSNAYTSTVRQGGAMELRFIAWAFWHSACSQKRCEGA